MTKTISATAPGKIILSGEHAVVYGSPVLALAVDRRITTTITTHHSEAIGFEFLGQKITTSLAQLRALRCRLDQANSRFTASDQLIQYAFIYLLTELGLTLDTGLHIAVTSAIPTGSGMGSSAATIISLLYAMLGYFERELPTAQSLTLARAIENLQHGKSSGTDLFLALHGGCYFAHGGEFTPRTIPTLPLQLINTHQPQSSTGDCVAHVAHKFQTSDLSAQFAAITQHLDQALQQHDLAQTKYWVTANHELLHELGVVPPRVAQFIAAVQNLGNAAKISGAGAISGDNAGMVVMVGTADCSNLAAQYGYDILPITGAEQGAVVM